MWNPIIYRSYNQNSVVPNKYFLEKATKLFHWKKREKILDIGCGDGGATIDLILPKLPQDFTKVLAIDKSTDMINFAKDTYKNPKITFREYTLPNPEFATRFSSHFDHVFALACLHWIPEARKMLGTMAAVLKPGGQALMTIMICPQIDAVRDMYNTKKWEAFMGDFRGEQTFPYQWLPDPVSYLADNLAANQFKTQFCEILNVSCLHSKVSFEEFSVLLNPYACRVPENKQAEFRRDYFQRLAKDPQVEYARNNKNEIEVVMNHKALGAFVQKI